MARTLILNISALAQTLPAIYGGHVVSVGHGRVVSDETSVAVAEMGGFAAIDGNWVVYPVSTDTAEGDYDVAAGGVALLATFVPGGGGGGGGPVNWADILGKPSFSPVATSGSYDDLADVPTLADVAETGLYSDLSGTPSIPVAGNTVADVGNTGGAGVAGTFSRVDHQHAHGNLNGGSLHATVTTVTAGFMSAADKNKLDAVPASFANVATSGSYEDLTNKPSLFDGDYNSLTNTPAFADVATSGDAADLSHQAYDIIGDAVGNLAVGKVIMTAVAPRAVVLNSIQQAGGTRALVTIYVNDVAASYPQSVSAGAIITAVVSTAGEGAAFAINGEIA